MIAIIQNVRYYFNFSIDVVDSHLESVSCIFWEEERKALISCSEDKTVKMVQFPVYWPSEMILDKEKISSKADNPISQLFGTGKSENKKNISVSNKNENKTKKPKEGLTEPEIWSEDLDGWSFDL